MTRPKKQINPKCPKCERRVVYVLDTYEKGKRIRLCQRCYNEREEKLGEQQLKFDV